MKVLSLMDAGSALSRVLRRLGLVHSDLRGTLRQWLLLLWDHVADRFEQLSNQLSDRFDRISGQIANGFERLSDRIYDGADFDIGKLNDRAKRWSNIAQIRRSAAAVSLGDGNVICRTLGKYRQYVVARDVGFSPYVMLDGFYEYHVTEFVARNVKPGMQVMDIGANFGYFTLLMADLVGPTGMVYAFEPNPNVATLLGYSLRANNFTSRAVVDRRAISDRAGMATFLIPAVALTNARIIDPIDPAQTGSSPDLMYLTVETVALDDVHYEGINFIKVDIEGAEEKLWHGGKSFFARNPDLLCVLEFNCKRCASPQATLEDISRKFRLRCLDETSYLRDVTINEMLESEFDWLLVLSQREEVD